MHHLYFSFQLNPPELYLRNSVYLYPYEDNQVWKKKSEEYFVSFRISIVWLIGFSLFRLLGVI